MYVCVSMCICDTEFENYFQKSKFLGFNILTHTYFWFEKVYDTIELLIRQWGGEFHSRLSSCMRPCFQQAEMEKNIIYPKRFKNNV